MADGLLGRQSAHDEARALYRLIGCDEETEESLRSLIAVPAWIERVLHAYAQAFPEEAYFVERVLKSRVECLHAFERPVLDGLPVDGRIWANPAQASAKNPLTATKCSACVCIPIDRQARLSGRPRGFVQSLQLSFARETACASVRSIETPWG